MPRWNAVSDVDYDEELNPRRRHPHCRTCGEPMQVVYGDDDRPVFCRCDACARDKAMKEARTA